MRVVETAVNDERGYRASFGVGGVGKPHPALMDINLLINSRERVDHAFSNSFI